jgi:hypothetical protein
MGALGNAYYVSVQKPAGKKPAGSARQKWQDHIKRDLKEVEIKCVNYIGLT